MGEGQGSRLPSLGQAEQYLDSLFDMTKVLGGEGKGRATFECVMFVGGVRALQEL